MDELNPDSKSPEAIITNGQVHAAVEVKGLIGDPIWQAYLTSLLSLHKRLKPRPPGRYRLTGPDDLQLPISRDLMELLATEANRVAPTLDFDEAGFVSVPRAGTLDFVTTSSDAHVFCDHAEQWLVQNSDVHGHFYLRDESGAMPWTHVFASDRAKIDFLAKLQDSFAQSLRDGSTLVSWTEEWELRRFPSDPEGVVPDGVLLQTGGVTGDLVGGLSQTIDRLLEAARAKFIGCRWAQWHVIIIHHSFMWPKEAVSLAATARAIANAKLDGVVDVVVLINRNELTEIWRSPDFTASIQSLRIKRRLSPDH